MPQFKDGESSQFTSEMMSWSGFGALLTKIRIAPCNEASARFHLRRAILSSTDARHALYAAFARLIVH